LETIRAGKRPIVEIYWGGGPSINPRLDAELSGATSPVIRLSAPELTTVAGSPHHQGVAAKVGPFPYAEFDATFLGPETRPGLVLILDEIQDPSNLGSILRSAECLGGSGVIISKDRCAQVTPAVEKVASGASAHIAVSRVVNLVRAVDMLKDEGYWIYAADVAGPETLYSTDLTGRTAVVLGSEEKGIRRLLREKCDRSVSIPMCGRVQSLNVAQAAAAILAESQRQRIAAGETMPCK